MTHSEARRLIDRCLEEIVGDAMLQGVPLSDATHLAYEVGLESLELIGLVEALAAHEAGLLQRLDLSVEGMRELTIGRLREALCGPRTVDG